jgi:hypothetical protein
MASESSTESVTGLGRSDLIRALESEQKKCEELEKHVLHVTKLLSDIHYAIGKRESHGVDGDAQCILEWIADAQSSEEPFV